MRLFVIFIIPYFIYATNLHNAVRHQDVKALLEAINIATNIDLIENKQTALGLATKIKNKELMSLLLDAGANVNSSSPFPIVIALLGNDSKIIDLLLKNGANLPENFLFSNFNKGLLYDLLLKKLYNSVSSLLDYGVSFKDEGKLNIFSLALSFAPIYLIEKLIDHGTNLNYLDPYLGRPLEIALRLKRYDVINLLIKKGVNVEDAAFLKIAVLNEDIKSLQILVKANSIISDKYNDLPLLAVKQGNLPILKELIKAKASLDFVQPNGETILTQAVKYDKKDILLWLLSIKPDVDVHNKAMIYAIKNNNLDIVEILAKNNIGLNAKDNHGLTPLLIASKYKQFNIANFLLTLEIDINGKDKLLESALFKSVRFFQDDMLNTLLAKDININEKNDLKLSALDVSILVGNFNAFKKILDSGAKIDKAAIFLSVKKGFERFYIKLKDKFNVLRLRNFKRDTLLHVATSRDQTYMLQRLIFDGISLNKTNKRGETALHIAAKKGFIRSSSLLLRLGANIAAKDTKGNTARMLAYKYNHPKLGKWLKDYEIILNSVKND